MRTLAPLLLLTGCFGSETTVFPPGLEPLEAENRAEWPAGSGYPETLSLAEGAYDEDLDWVHARGYLHAPLADVYAALRTPDVDVDRREVDSWTVTWDVEDYPTSYVIHNRVDDVITVEFDVTWRHAAVEGTESEPEKTAARWQKTEGSPVITVLEGSAVAWEVADGVTALELQENLESIQSDTHTIASYLTDLFGSVRATVHGEPLPEYR